MNHTICYLSSAAGNLPDHELKQLFKKTQSRNIDQEISGILLFYYGNFLQVLEGDKDRLHPLFDIIKKDNRHKNIITIFNKQNEGRTFAGYKSGFSIVKTSSDLKNLNVYLNNNKDKTPLSSSVLSLLEPFLI
ncbi:BLUF domain-containing protein [Marixanthomonas spongiae]|nr:BLUF domain-containing protein [Marixanthomonas spongiae]